MTLLNLPPSKRCGELDTGDAMDEGGDGTRVLAVDVVFVLVYEAAPADSCFNSDGFLTIFCCCSSTNCFRCFINDFELFIDFILCFRSDLVPTNIIGGTSLKFVRISGIHWRIIICLNFII
jgi:hypothetical protein